MSLDCTENMWNLQNQNSSNQFWAGNINNNTSPQNWVT